MLDMQEKNNKRSNKVRDHCRIAGKYRGAAHKESNLKLKISRILPIIFHNLQGYDSHIIFKVLHKFSIKNIDVIPKSSEKYMSIIINNNITFLDSLQFQKASLDNLTKHLEDKDFKYMSSEFINHDIKDLRGKIA